MTDIYKKISELNSKYGNESSEFEEELVEQLKKKFPEQYQLSLEDLKNDGSDDPEMEMTPGRFVDHIGDKSDELLKEYETILKNLTESSMPKFKAVYLFDKIYDFEGIKEIEAKDIKEAVEKLKKAGRRGHLIDENYDTGEKPIYSPRRMHVFNSEKFSDIIEAQENEDSPDVVIDEDFTFEE